MIRLLLNLIYFCNLLSPTDSLRRWRLQFETFFFWSAIEWRGSSSSEVAKEKIYRVHGNEFFPQPEITTTPDIQEFCFLAQLFVFSLCNSHSECFAALEQNSYKAMS
jgi:hypothetical protein